MEGKKRQDESIQEGLDEEDIKGLFDRVAGSFEERGERSREMFSMLVRAALAYRDRLMHSSGQALTVGETRTALDAFMEVLKTHSIPKGLDVRVHNLVVMWLEGLREEIHH